MSDRSSYLLPPQYPYSPTQMQYPNQAGYSPPMTKPTAGMVLSVLAGVFVIIGGLSFLLVQGVFGYYLSGIAIEAVCAPIGVIIGVIMIIGAADAYSKPQRDVPWGVTIIILSLVSWAFALGGMIIGSILGLAGGILIAAHKASPLVSQPQIIVREREVVKLVCRNCNAIVDFSVATCPYCGHNPH